MTAAWEGTPVAFNERENLRFDAVIVMPDDTVCLWIHNAHPVRGVEEANALFSWGGKLLPMNDMTFAPWTQKCVDQQGRINVLPELEDNANQLQQKMNDLNQQLHDAQQ